VKGLLVTLEGMEASGKSTVARRLAYALGQWGLPSLLLREPGGTPLGERLRRLLKGGAGPQDPWAEAFLFLSARAELVARRLRPALEAGRVVVCDRFADSTLAYQGYGRGLDLETLRGLNRLATGALTPHLTLLLDLTPEVALARLPGPPDRFEAEGLAFHQRVREGYLALAREEPERWRVLDATRPLPEVVRDAREAVRALLEAQGIPIPDREVRR